MTKSEFVKSLTQSDLKIFFVEYFDEDERIRIFREVVVEGNGDCEADFFPFEEDKINYRLPSAYEAMRATQYGNVDWDDSWLRINAYGNLESISDITDFMLMYIDEMEEYLIENYEDEICEHFNYEE